ncbi:MAG: chloride channel protein [Pseudobdellovibrio sp.]
MHGINFENFKYYLKMFFLSVLVGAVAGLSTALLLQLLKQVTDFRETHRIIIYFLPFGGLLIGLAYYHYGKTAEGGTGLILDEVHNPQNIIPLIMAPLVFMGTVVTHLFGGSAGREGTAVQVSSTLADQVAKVFSISKKARRNLLIAGAGAGFSAAIGAPLAGAIFGLELVQVGKFKLPAVFESCIASSVSFYVCKSLGFSHSIFATITSIEYSLNTIFAVIASGIFFGLASRGFIWLTHVVVELNKRYIQNAPLRPFVGGLLLLFLFWLEGSYRFIGLGFPTIQNAFLYSSSVAEPILKAGFTALTVGSGFKGGEFIPLVFIGTTLGSFLASVFSVSVPLFAALGFAAVFGSASNTPLACTIMAMEIFGWQVGPFAFSVCLIAFYFSGKRSIYKKKIETVCN